MIGDMGQEPKDIKKSRENQPSPEEVEAAEAFLDYYQSKRGITYGSKKRAKHLDDMIEAIKTMRDNKVNPLRYFGWAMTTYEPPYLNMVLSSNNIRRFAKEHANQSKNYLRSDKNAIRARRKYGLSDLKIYNEIRHTAKPLTLYMFIQKGGVNKDAVNNYSEIEQKALIQWRVLNEEQKQNLLDFFDLDDFNFHM